MCKQILIIAAHSDDEVLGCGGTIAKHVSVGDEVHVIFMTDGVGARGEIEKATIHRIAAMETATKILGVASTINLDFPDNRMDDVALLDIVKPLEKLIERIQPETIYTHHFGDLNIDHRITHQAVMTACRPVPDTSIKDIMTFEVLSSTEWQTTNVFPFIPNTYIDISTTLELKLAAIDAYKEEMRSAPHSRSLRHVEVIAAHRGMSVGVEYAESFCLVRSLR